jgi:hypothetical protein
MKKDAFIERNERRDRQPKNSPQSLGEVLHWHPELHIFRSSGLPRRKVGNSISKNSTPAGLSRTETRKSVGSAAIPRVRHRPIGVKPIEMPFVDRFERSEGNCLNHWIERENTTTQ